MPWEGAYRVRDLIGLNGRNMWWVHRRMITFSLVNVAHHKGSTTTNMTTCFMIISVTTTTITSTTTKTTIDDEVLEPMMFS